ELRIDSREPGTLDLPRYPDYLTILLPVETDHYLAGPDGQPPLPVNPVAGQTAPHRKHVGHLGDPLQLDEQLLGPVELVQQQEVVAEHPEVVDRRLLNPTSATP